MTLGGASQSESALLAYNKRKAQLERWRGSDTEKESTEIRSRPKRVKFADKCIFQAACASNDKAQVARMIKEGYDINAVDEDGITALHQACIEDNFDMVEFLLENGADVNISDNEGWTPLHAVATCCYVSIAKLLLEHGANVVALNNDCSIPLDICKSDEIRELFIQEINGKGIDVKDARRGEELKMMEDAKRWLSSGHVDEAPHPVTGATALHVAACKGYIKVLDMLIKAGANINSQDFDGWTPLHAAAHWGQREACEVLLENMCDMSIRNNCDLTALDIADSSVVNLLEEWKKSHDVNKNIETQGARQTSGGAANSTINNNNNINNINNNNNNNDGGNTAAAVPRKKVTNQRAQEEVTILSSPGSQGTGVKSSASSTAPPDSSSGTQGDVGSEEHSKEPAPATSSPANKSISERLTVRRTRSEAAAGADSSLRRAYSFESDSKFYTRLRDARQRIKAMEEASARLSSSCQEETSGPPTTLVHPTPSSSLRTSATEVTPAGSVVSSSRPFSSAETVRRRDEDTPSSSTETEALPSIPSASPLPSSTTTAESTCNVDNNNETNSTDPETSITSSGRAHGSIALHSSSEPESAAEHLFSTVLLRRRSRELDGNRQTGRVSGSGAPTSTTSSSSTPAASTTSSASTAPTIPANTSETKSPRSSKVGNNFEGNHQMPMSPLLFSFSGNGSSLSLNQAVTGKIQSGPVTKFKNFFKSFVPPTRDEESETQRKAHAKRVRETRRSTQGVTLEELKSAEQYVKNSQSTPGGTNSVPVSSTRREQEDVNVERRPSWRLRVDEQDRSKFSLEDTRQGGSSGSASSSSPGNRSAAGVSEIPYGLAQRNPSLRSKLGKGIQIDQSMLGTHTSTNPASSSSGTGVPGKPPLPPGEQEQSHLQQQSGVDGDKDSKSSGGAQGAILRKKKPKRRSTGVVQFNPEATHAEPKDSVPSDSEIGRDVSSDVDQGADASSNRGENGVCQRINYRKLYEEVLKENQLLKSKLSRAEEDIAELKLKLDKMTVTPRITTDDTEKMEKRALERKLSEMEEELKQMQKLKLDTEKLKAENRALSRVVSKLSGGSGGSATPAQNQVQEIRHLRSENQKLRDENGALIRVISKLSK